MSLNHEKALRLLHQNAAGVVDAYDEVLAVMFAVAWQPNLGDDLPFGSAVFKRDDKQEVQPEVLLSCLRQTSKLGMHLVGNMGGWLKNLQISVGHNNKLEGEVNDLRQRLAKYEGDQATQATRPDDAGVPPGNTNRPKHPTR